ncbi:hypothetical protein [Pseudomonas nitroreducens]|uniref:hypothetical protein n=1 Tax=Pseudomonas nitroreducens TaxID=46680 RepID=UPI001FB5C55D|nr:hypothetical protein [Pseudomonas nitroreducens]MCJ1880743.1 hypothetical protein [Pseudomonas nitroreducens]MCJ1895739.1 hypothetical protein [Pseudomonas nitroreducens]
MGPTKDGTYLFFYSKTGCGVRIRVPKINLSPFFDREGVSYSPKFLPCASSECISTGANLDFSSFETLQYLKAADAKSLSDLSKILGIGAVVTGGTTAVGLALASNIPALVSGYMKGDLSGAATSAALSIGFESYASSRGLTPDMASKIANILTVMGAWDGIVENSRGLYK